MTDPAPVLVGVDGSPAGSAAIRFAAHEAQRRGTGIRLVHMVPSYSALVGVPWAITPVAPVASSDLEAAGNRILRRAIVEAQQDLDPSLITSALHYGPRLPTLLEMAEHACLVVIGSQPRPVIDRLLTGSTLVGLASRATVPVIAVPRGWSAARESHRIVVGVKSTGHSPELVRRALEIASQRGAEVELVHAWELPNEYDDLVSARVNQDAWTERARRTIEESIAGLRDAYPDVPMHIRVRHGQAARVLQLASAEADLLLLARRRSGFPIGHLGGTARVLLREARCPVVVLPPADQPGDAPDLVQG